MTMKITLFLAILVLAIAFVSTKPTKLLSKLTKVLEKKDGGRTETKRRTGVKPDKMRELLKTPSENRKRAGILHKFQTVLKACESKGFSNDRICVKITSFS
jgi:hypothetical protein